MSFWSFALHDLGLTSDEFYALTPRQYSALSKRHKYKTEHLELLFGQLTAYVVNTSTRAPEKPVATTDFMPSHFKYVEPESAKRRVGRQFHDWIEQLKKHGAFVARES